MENHKDVIQIVLFQIYSTFQSIRTLLRRLSVASDVPIEPPLQTSICDASLEIPGVLISGVPGGNSYFVNQSRWIRCNILHYDWGNSIEATKRFMDIDAG